MPALSLAVVLCACCLFASDPPMPYAGYTSIAPLQSTPAAEPRPSKLATNTTEPRRQAAAPASCKDNYDCVKLLDSLINDPKRDWLAEPQSAAEYANGARFFAYRALRQTLSCRELVLASQDLTVAKARLSAPSKAVSAARAAAALSLSTSVATELRNEMTERC